MSAQSWLSRKPPSILRRLEEGQDIIEYALILPFLLLLTFSVIDGGWLIFRYNTIANAAREGARAGIIPVSAACALMSTGLPSWSMKSRAVSATEAAVSS